MKKIIYILFLCLMAGVISIPARAQKGDKPMQKIQQFKKMKLLETLDLDEETANKFLVKYDKWEKQLADNHEQRAILVQELHLALEKNSSDDDLNHTIDSLVDLAKKADDMRHQMFEDLRSILSAKQSAKLTLFEAQFQKKLQETLSKMQQHRDRGDEPHLH